MCQDGTESVRLIENPNVPEVYCDGIASVEVMGVMVLITYFAFRVIAGERVRFPTLEMRRPLESCLGYPLRDLTLQAIAGGGTAVAPVMAAKAH